METLHPGGNTEMTDAGRLMAIKPAWMRAAKGLALRIAWSDQTAKPDATGARQWLGFRK